VDLNKLRASRLSFYGLSRAIGAENVTVSGGSTSTWAGRSAVRVAKASTCALPTSPTSSEEPERLRPCASATSPRDRRLGPQNYAARLDGKPPSR
jgi:hypothetical protein